MARNYKESLSDFEGWSQKEHSADWVLLAANIGGFLSIDETMIGDDVYTILSNKDGHGGRGRWSLWSRAPRPMSCRESC